MISNLRLQHFRSYTDEAFEFSPSVNIIVGPNASGKTNLLEAILVLSRGSSYRVKDADLVAYDQPWARLDAQVSFEVTDRTHSPLDQVIASQADSIRLPEAISSPSMAEDRRGGDSVVIGNHEARIFGESTLRTVKLINEPRPSKTYEIEGKVYRRLLASKTLPVVIFEPNHLAMLSGSPDLRRSYLDDLLEQLDPLFGRLRKDYRRVLTQRNALLKHQGMAAAGQVFPWNIRLGEIGGAIVAARRQLVDAINSQATELYTSLAHAPYEVELKYESPLPLNGYASALLRALEANFAKDVARGFTGAGPHREDLSLLLNGKPSQISASRGEARTAVLMLKVMELQLLDQARGVRPLLLLDDVFSELDGARRRALTGYLQDYQTFITTTDADVVVQHFMDHSQIIPLAGKDKG